MLDAFEERKQILTTKLPIKINYARGLMKAERSNDFSVL
jgi:hypothetical protein